MAKRYTHCGVTLVKNNVTIDFSVDVVLTRLLEYCWIESEVRHVSNSKRGTCPCLDPPLSRCCWCLRLL